MDLDEIRKFNKMYKKQHNTINQIINAFRKYPNMQKEIFHLPIINQFYRIIEKIVPETLLDRVKIKFTGRNKANLKNHTEEKIIFPMTKREINFYLIKTHVKIDKAKNMLGYQPKYDLENGMKATEAWLRYANMS